MNILSPQWMLLIGIFLALFTPYNQKREKQATNLSKKILQLSVILLGASLNFNIILKQGASGLGVTFLNILFIFAIGFAGIKLLKIEIKQGLLITMGTAICGGSAIAALAPIILADSMAIAVSMGIVFLLNSIAIFIFPTLGEILNLSQEQFGVFSALAIHDTSSVVAAASIYGDKALEVGTTFKLTRALWIIPISILFSIFYKTEKKNKKTKIKIPWFISGFLILSLIFTFIDIPYDIKSNISKISKLGFSITLFLIGYTFNLNKIKQVGAKPLIFGVGIWLIVITSSLTLIRFY